MTQQLYNEFLNSDIKKKEKNANDNKIICILIYNCSGTFTLKNVMK